MIQSPKEIEWLILGDRYSRTRIRTRVLNFRPEYFLISQDRKYNLIATKKYFHFFIIKNKILFVPKTSIKEFGGMIN